MSMVSIICAAKRNKDQTFDAEVAITFYDQNSSITSTTEQRTVSKGHTVRVLAEASAMRWVEEQLFPVVKRLPKAKP